jgi:hypothetical protein
MPTREIPQHVPVLSTNQNHRMITPLAFVNQLSQIPAQGQISDLYELRKKLPDWGQAQDPEIRSSDLSEKSQAD